MQKIIVRNGAIVSYSVARISRTRKIKLVVTFDGRVEVSAPNKIDEKIIEDFVMSKVDWVVRILEQYKNRPRIILDSSNGEDWSKHKEYAYLYIKERLEYFNQFYNLKWNSITVKKIKSRWGSCSSKSNLNFNYKLALLSPDLADYIIVHELCHLQEMNHSVDFWNLVGRTIPNHKELRRELKTFI